MASEQIHSFRKTLIFPFTIVPTIHITEPQGRDGPIEPDMVSWRTVFSGCLRVLQAVVPGRV